MRRLLALVIIAVAVGGFMWLKSSRPPPPQVEVRERVWRVAAETVESATQSPVLTLYGRTEAPDRVRAAAPVSGRVLELAVRDGERVEAGRVLARMDPRDFEPRLFQARADVEREQARARHDRNALEQERALLALAEAKLARFGALATARLGAETAADQAREEVARARLAVSQRELAIAEQPARLAQLESRLAEAERDAERAEVVAPYDARIARVEVAAGDQVQAGQTLLSFHAADALYLRAKLPAIYAAELAQALDAGKVLSAEVEFGASRMAARLVRIGGEADARGVDVLLQLDGAEGVPVGAFVNAIFERPAVTDVFSLPMSALHGGDRIYRIDDENRLRALIVERVGEHRVAGVPRMLVQATGLASGDRVMSTHLPNAIDGLAVEIVAGGTSVR
ncbi:efflux RND transporter periplasmic adaptor subunit [Azoarcus taiwanensis]|uniref:Efflux RND transporter periplasmic adaptor subunit n=1 Tax=Azoarcus taiwanensis TaxID=666964 RepID=A0A972FIU8_9RHOO|nr:efflux RND transporter periplasmic adaptor subunit [Azoarcus taiwanensis]NMG03106.1 efflux RND transporter periplasmic adaptor subunit [Azoarcus taiwanensis]